jgi:chromosome segregation ATPase
MSLEDAKNRIQQSQEAIDQANLEKRQAEREQSAIERELREQISGAVNKAVFAQDLSINRLSDEVHTNNERYLELHKDMVALQDALKDTTHLQELYDIRNKELDAEYKDKKKVLEKSYQDKSNKLESEYNDKVREHKAAMQEADADYMRRSAERSKKREELEQEIKTEEEKLRKRKYDLQWKRKGIIIGIIICFLVAIIGGIVLGMWLNYQGYIPFEFTQPTGFGG